MIKVLFFGQLRERIDTSELAYDLQQANYPLGTVKQLRNHLQSINNWHEYFELGKVLVAVNQQIVNDDTSLSDGDEVAFFPPVTGG